jgi:peptidyl-prolyl cis-trans isomerase B (cyclophilin B)
MPPCLPTPSRRACAAESRLPRRGPRPRGAAVRPVRRITIGVMPTPTRGAATFLVRLTSLGLLLAATALAQDARLPVPEAAARAPLVAQVKKEWKDDLAAKDPDVRRKAARAMLERAGDAKTDAAMRYVLLEQAAVAADVHDVQLARAVARRLGETFQVEATAKQLAAVDAATRGVKEPVVLADAATACVEIAGEALAADDAKTAGDAVAAGKRLAASAKVGGLAARAEALTELVAAYRRLATAAEPARTALAATPDDPAANEARGRFLAFGRGDWTAGLPLLAKGADAALKDVAAKDAAHPEDVGSKAAVADAWWQAAQKEKDPLAKARMLARAAATYRTLAGAKEKLDALTWTAWEGGVALTKDFSKAGPSQLGLATIRAFIEKQHVEKNSANWRTKVPRFPETQFAASDQIFWTLETNKGAITIRLWPDVAPNHVANCIYLTELGFYDGGVFHRVIPGFMAQAGGPPDAGNVTWNFGGEFGGPQKFDKGGLLAMANAGPNTDSTQFFITYTPQAHLNGLHTIFGEVVSGMDVAKKLEDEGSASGATKSQLLIERARITVR